MGYQQKSYKKFVATAATATLVASAIVPVASASFSDVADTNEFAAYINTAVEAGYIKGYENGTFGINDNLKRSHVVIIIGRYLEKLGYTSEATTSPWSDVTSEEVIKYGNIVKDAGVFTGYADGTLKGGGFISRENMAIVLDRLAKTVTNGTSLSDVAKDIEDVKIADLETAAPTYQAAIQALRDLEISTADNFNPKGNVKRGHFAKFIVTAVEKIDAIEVTAAEGIAKKIAAVDATLPAVADITADNAEVAIAAVEAAKTEIATIKAEIADAELTEEEVAELEKAIAAVEAKYAAIVEAADKAIALTVESVTAINAKSLKVTFNKEVPADAAVTVKKGSVTSNVSKTTWNEDRTEVTLELAGKLTAGEYTVTVAQEGKDALTGSVKVENETVAEVKLLSENAVFNSGKTNVTVGYQVLNQYGEDITAKYAVNPTAAGATVNTSGTVTASRGVVTVPVTGAKEGDKVVVTLVHVGTGKSVSQTLTISAVSAVADIQIKGIYNKDSKTLNETSNLTRDAFYLVVEGKDQYGNAVEAAQLDALLKNNTNSAVVGLATSFETIKIDGKDATVLRLTGTPTAGTTNVMLISSTTGKNASTMVTVAEAQRADTITFQVPELVVAGESLFVPVTVLDKDGVEITDIDVLNDATRGIKIGGSSNALTKNAKGVIGYNAGTPTEGYVSLVGLSATNKAAVQNIKVEAAAKPTVVRGLAKTESAVVLANKGLTKASLVVEDQYGRAMTAQTTPLTLAASSSATSGYRIVATDISTNNVITNNTTLEIYNSGTVTLLKGTNGTEKVEFSIEEYKNNKWTAVAGSSQDIEFRVTDGTEYASYEVEEIGKMLDTDNASNSDVLTDSASDYAKDVVVYGVLDDGKKVKLPTSAYTVVTSDNLTYDSGTLTTNVSDASYEDKATEVTGKATVTISATGQQFVKDVTISKVAPKVVDFKIVANSADIDSNNDDVISEEEYARATELTTVTATGTTFFSSADAVKTLVDFVAVDSYGVITQEDTASEIGNLPVFTFVGTPAVAHTVTFENQNSDNLTVTGLEKDEVVTLTAIVDGISKSFKLAGIVDSLSDVATAVTATTVTIDASNVATLPATHAATGTTITWTKAGTTVLGTTSVSAGDKLVATFTKGSATTTKTYTVAGTAGSLTVN